MFIFKDERMILSADKGLGYTIMYVEDVKNQYIRINNQQHFSLSDVDEDWYISSVLEYISQAKLHLPLELSKIITEKDFEINITEPKIGVLRLLPKILKLKTVPHSEVKSLKCRGIKSSLQDPIKIIQLILDKYLSHILFYMEQHFAEKYGKMGPTVVGVNEALERLKGSEKGEWGSSIDLEGDFSDLYSNVDITTLKKYVQMGSEIAGISKSSQTYILNLLEVNSRHSYFKEPTGIFRKRRTVLKMWEMHSNFEVIVEV